MFRRDVRLTRRGWAFIGLLALLYFSSMQAQAGLLYLVIGLVVGCYAVNGVAAWRGVGRLRFKRFDSVKATENEPIKMAVSVVNDSDRAAGMVDVFSTLYGTLFKIGAMPAGETLHATPEVVFPRRGVYPVGELRLSSTFPFGLIRIAEKVKRGGEFVVRPELYACRPPRAAGFEPMVGGSHTGKHRSLTGSDYQGVRPFRDGDPMKFIDWKASSKGAGLMVKEFNEELAGRVSIIVDPGADETDDGDRLIDWAARAAGSVAFAALDQNHHVELIDLNESKLLRNPSFQDGEAILEFLARLKIRGEPLASDAPRHALDLASKRSAVCLVATAVNPVLIEFLEHVVAEGRVVTVMIPTIDSNGDAIPPGVTVKRYGKNSIAEG